MTLMDCYAALGGNYDDVIGRLRSERLVQKLLLKFPDDPSYDLLRTSMAEGNDSEAFRAAHTLKGICLNLGFTNLQHSSSALTEALRHGRTPEAEPCLAQVTEDYQNILTAIKAYDQK